MSVPYSGQIPLATITETGAAPKSRVDNPSDAHDIIANVIDCNRERIRFWTRLKGCADGNPPYDAGKLRNAGQANRTNINFLEFGASVKAACVPYYELFSGSNMYVQVHTAFGNGTDSEDWSQIISEEFDWLLRQYDAFDYHMQRIIFDHVLYGRAFAVWEDRMDWRFKSIPQIKVLTVDGAMIHNENLDVLVVRENMRVHELYRKIRNKESAKRLGWKPESVIAAIRHAMPQTQNGSTATIDYDFVQQRMADHDLFEGLRSATVQAAHLFVKEFDGKISHFILLEDQYSERDTDQKKTTDFLFSSIGRFKNWKEIVSTFFLETQDGSWNGAYGLGKEIFAPMEIKNRLICSSIDNTFIRAGITLQAVDAAALQKTSLVQIGNMNIIPPGYNVQQATVLGDVNSLLQMDNALDMKLTSNTGVYKQKMDKPTGNPRTAEEVRLQYQTSAVLGNSSVNRFYLDCDKLYNQTFKRASNPNQTGSDEGAKLAREFQKRCEKRGVPLKALALVDSVKAYRNIGNGSLFMKQQAISQLASFYGAFPEEGKSNYLQDVVSVTAGQSLSKRYVPRKREDEIPSEDQAEAMLENAALKIGAPVLWVSTQNNVIHAQAHLLAGTQAIASMQQGADPVEVHSYLEMIGEHCAVHIQKLSEDPTRQAQFKALEAQWKQMAGIADKLGKQIGQMQQQAQEQQAQSQQLQAVQTGVDPDTMIKLEQARNDMAIKKAKAEQQLMIKHQKTQQDMALKDAQAASAVRNSAITTVAG